jgi:hypothetical protein
MTIRDGCLIDNEGMAIVNLFNNKIDNLIFFGAVELAHPKLECLCTLQC